MTSWDHQSGRIRGGYHALLLSLEPIMNEGSVFAFLYREESNMKYSLINLLSLQIFILFLFFIFYKKVKININ